MVSKKPLLALVMIVKDEAQNIHTTLESVQGTGTVEHCTILDTGSADGTQDIIRRFPNCYLHEEKFEDFATARNHVLDLESSLSNSATFALSLSGDETLHQGDVLRRFLENQSQRADLFNIEIRLGTTTWAFPRVIRIGSKWRYEGTIHEQLIHQDRSRDCTVRTGEGSSLRAPGLILHQTSDPLRRAQNDYARDLPLIKKEVTENPHDSRLLILLAQTLERMAMTETELSRALALYQEASSTQGHPREEMNYARMKYLNCVEKLGILPEEILLEHLQALSSDDPTRPETAYMLAVHTAGKDLSKGLETARIASEIAERANKLPGSIPHEITCAWRSSLLAATCAKALGHSEVAHQQALRAVALGGPPRLTDEFPAL